MTGIAEAVVCEWCHGQSAPGTPNCERCGAALDIRNRVTDSGWRQAPRMRALSEVHFGQSSIQIDTGIVPVAELSLHPSDSVFFEHHAMLWKDDTVPMSVMSTPGGARRLLGDLPFVLSVARGPGRVAFSRDAAGALVVLPVDPGMEIELRGHAMLLASGSLTYSFTKVPGVKVMLMAGTGMYLDQFTSTGEPGVLILHGYGNVFERTLAPGESLQLAPGAFLYKESSVTMEVLNVDILTAEGEKPQSAQGAKQMASRGFKGLKAMRGLMSDGVAGAAQQLMSGGAGSLASAFSTNTNVSLMRLTGPGRVGMQSMYQPRVTD